MSHRSRPAFRALTIAALIAPFTGACIPYGVGTTAMPIARDSTHVSTLVTVIPSVGTLDSTRPAPFLSTDVEVRRGIDSVSDAGLRLVSAFSGLVVNYKRLVTRTNEPALIAVMPGIGLINMGEHAHFELTLLASGRETRVRDGRTEHVAIVPYGGMRVMQVAPLNSEAVHDTPTAGAFLGVRFGKAGFGVSPEIGVFYDRSALGHRQTNVVVVPTISMHGDELFEFIRRGGRPGLRRPQW
jgi:hypothetical protein